MIDREEYLINSIVSCKTYVNFLYTRLLLGEESTKDMLAKIAKYESRIKTLKEKLKFYTGIV